jgi:hypothetical protein
MPTSKKITEWQPINDKEAAKLSFTHKVPNGLVTGAILVSSKKQGTLVAFATSFTHGMKMHHNEIVKGQIIFTDIVTGSEIIDVEAVMSLPGKYVAEKKADVVPPTV